MPRINKHLALVFTFSLVATSIQHAQARGDIESDSTWFNQQPADDEAGRHHPALPQPTPDFYFAEHATTRNGLQVARKLDSVVEALLGSDELTDWDRYQLENIGEYLASLEPGRVGELLEQLAGTQNANLGSATQNSLKQLNSSLLSTMRQLSDTTTGNNANGRFWLQGLGGSGSLDGQHGSAGLQQRTQGLVLGADWAVDHAWRVGVLGAKSASNLSAKGFKAQLDSWHLGGYAVRQDGPLALRLGAIYSSHDGRNKRSFDFLDYREQLKGKYAAQSQNIFAEFGYQVGNGSINAEPFVGLGYQRYHREGFKETGGSTALKVDAQTQGNLNSAVGIRVASLYTLDDQMSLKPHLSASWKHLYGDVDSTVRQSFAGIDKADFNSEFATQGTALDRDSLALQAGLDLGLSASQTVGLVYSADFGSRSRNQGIMGQWTMDF